MQDELKNISMSLKLLAVENEQLEARLKLNQEREEDLEVKGVGVVSDLIREYIDSKASDVNFSIEKNEWGCGYFVYFGVYNSAGSEFINGSIELKGFPSTACLKGVKGCVKIYNAYEIPLWESLNASVAETIDMITKLREVGGYE